MFSTVTNTDRLGALQGSALKHKPQSILLAVHVVD